MNFIATNLTRRRQAAYCASTPTRAGPLSLLLGATITLGACGAPTISNELKYLMSKPIDCKQAKEEIALLEAAKPNELKQTATAIMTIEPMGAIGAVVGGDLDNRTRVISGEHGADIDRRVRQMRQECGLPAKLEPKRAPRE